MNAAIAASALAGALFLGFPVAPDIMRVPSLTCAEPVLSPRGVVADQDPAGGPHLDRSKPVPTKPEIIRAWRKRQDAIKSFRFAWVEEECHARGWMPNPRYPEREWLAIPELLVDRNYSVAKLSR
jgi:hypothetical protein